MKKQRPEPKFDWFVPIDGDGRHIGTRRAERPPTFEYLREVVETAEKNGYYSLLIPTRFANGLFEEGAPLAETWTTATALAAVTHKIRFLIAVRPGFIFFDRDYTIREPKHLLPSSVRRETSIIDSSYMYLL